MPYFFGGGELRANRGMIFTVFPTDGDHRARGVPGSRSRRYVARKLVVVLLSALIEEQDFVVRRDGDGRIEVHIRDRDRDNFLVRVDRQIEVREKTHGDNVCVKLAGGRGSNEKRNSVEIWFASGT